MVSIPKVALEVILKYTPWFKRNKIPRVTNLWSSAFFNLVNLVLFRWMMLSRFTTLAGNYSCLVAQFHLKRSISFHLIQVLNLSLWKIDITFTFAWFRFIFPCTILAQLPTYLIVIPLIQLHTSSSFLFNCIRKNFYNI